MNRTRKQTDKRGMTMAEMLIVVAIIVVLAGLAFIAIWNYQRTLAQLERDKTAKEIFIAAQNHLTPAYGERYPGLFKIPEDKDSLSEDNKSTISSEYGNDAGQQYLQYFVVSNEAATGGNGGKVFDLMLPFGAIDETVRAGGSYIIKYDRAKGQVLEVFYCTKAGTRFGHTFASGEYTTVAALSGKGNKEARRNWNGAVVGWYGGAGLGTRAPEKLKKPSIKITNADRLTAEGKAEAVKKGAVESSTLLMVTGLSSGAQKYFKFEENNTNITKSGNDYTAILDDITSAQNMHFAEIFPVTATAAAPASANWNKKPFTPGENLKVQAINYSNSFLATIEYSAEKTTNSLFWDVESKKSADETTIDTAYINNIRHLENLDASISNASLNTNLRASKFNAAPMATVAKNKTSNAVATGKISIKYAVQASNLDWHEFFDGQQRVYGLKPTEGEKPVTDVGYFWPVNLHGVGYDGRGHSISSIKAIDGQANNAGLFSKADSSISNLELINFNIKGTNAGALAGNFESEDGVVENVIAHNTSPDAEQNEMRTITGTGNAGGLIGSMTKGKIQYSAAALTVSGSGNSGGLVGAASAGTIDHCFSGGHTDKGEYYKHKNNGDRDGAIYNVSGSTAGGLVGSSAAAISNSYSTCSVKGKNSGKAGGFVGSATADISNCYCTGLVGGESKGAFSGDVSDKYENCRYFEIINEEEKDGKIEYLKANGDKDNKEVTAIDASTKSYNSFVGARKSDQRSWAPANAYDKTLRKYYKLKYNLQTVKQLEAPTSDADKESKFVDTHYGDWPAPEIFVINNN